jgi:hypothetical protein
MPAKIANFEGVLLEKPELNDLLFKGVQHLVSIKNKEAQDRSLRFALSSSLTSLNTLIAAAAATCVRDNKPPAPIDMTNDDEGHLIYKCHHTPPHKWDISGNPLP